MKRLIYLTVMYIPFQQSGISDTGCMDDEDEDKNDEKLNNGLEDTSRGTVKGSIFIRYFQTGASLFRAFIVLFLFILTQLVVSLNDYFVPVL